VTHSLKPYNLLVRAACVFQLLTFGVIAQGQVASSEVDFGAIDMGSTSPVISVNFTFGTTATLGSVFVLTEGATGLDFANVRTGSCTKGTVYNVGDSCTVSMTFTPILAGVRYGLVALGDGSSNTISVKSVHGIGVGPQVNSVPSAESAASISALNPYVDVADAIGNVSPTSTTPIICKVPTLPNAVGICTIQSLAANLAAQAITFGAIPAQTVNKSVATALTAAASSGLPVSFTSTTPAICTVSGSTATLIAAGTCTIQANQAGNSVYAAAPMVAQSFTVWFASPMTDANSAIAVPITFGAAATLGSVSVLTQGATGLDFANAGTGTCEAGTSYNVGGRCTVNVTFTPMFAGTRYGAVVLQDGFGNVIATSYLQGTGVGPQVIFLPGAESTVPTSALSYPSGVAVDGSGNVYIVDSGNNRVLKETLSAGSYTESTVPTSALSYPSGVAVDGSGNVYIADSGNNRVLAETLSAGSYAENTVPTSALSYPSGVSVDGSGNVYIVDSGNNRVLKETLSAGIYTESTVPTSALAYPSGVSVDGSGNVYIADSGNNRVLKEMLSAGSYTESTVPTSALSYPSGVSVDGSGNVYIADSGNNRVLKEALSAGSYIESTVSTSSLSWPSAVAVAGSGNVYVVDAGNNRVLKEDFSDSPNVAFAATAPGSTSSDSPRTISVENFGNAALNFSIPSTGNNPGIAANFSLNSSGASSCPLVSAGSSAAGTLAAGQSCLLLISFTPTDAGIFSGTLVLTDNALNPTAPVSTVQQSLLLGGVGTGSTQQSIAFAAIPAQAASTILALTATASSGLPVIFTSTTPTICTVSDSNASLLASGICTIQANQGGSPVYAAAPVTTQSFAVNLAAQTITFGAIPAQAVNTSVGTALTATASSGLPVSFASTTSTICTVTNSTATLLADGTCTILATQPGDGVVYAAAPAVTRSFTVESATPLTDTNFGTVSIGSASSAIAVPITFNTAAILGSISVATQGAIGLDFTSTGAGTCTAGTSYNAGANCTISVTFTPTLAGTRYGAVVLQDGSGNVIATSYLQGTGVGPQVIFLPGAESTVPTSALAYPSGVAMDGSGNVYIVDSGNNRVLKETLSAGSYTESTVPTSVLNYPSGISVDGSGNLYIADSGNNRVLAETLSAGSYAESTVPTSALSYPSGVSVDGSGNVYIADSGNNRVLVETLSASSYTESTVPTSALSYPSGVAVDGGGNVYIVDSGNNRVLAETLSAGSYAESTVPTSALSYPSGVSVDGSGNVYIADSGNNRVLVETLSAGSYTESTVSTSSLSWPSAVAVAGSGNIYVLDAGNNRGLEEDFADPPSLSFATTVMGSTSSDSPRTVTLENAGNAALNFPVPSTGINPDIPANFTLNSNGASSCPLVSAGTSTARALAAGQSCLLSISFTPTAAGTLSGILALTDNALNATAPGYTTQSFLLNGTGTGSTQQTIAFGAIQAQTANSILALTATASSGLLVSFTSVTPAICAVSGTTASLLATGVCTIQANQGGSSVYAVAAPVTQSFTVNGLGQTITFGAIQAQTINTSVAIALTATASSGLPVNYTSTTTSICTVSGSTATLLAAGTCTIQATQAGNAVYAAASVVTQSFTAESSNPLTGTSFGTVNIGSASSAIAVPITFNTAGTLDSIYVLTQGATGLDFAIAGAGTCTAGASYNAGANCTISVIFTPMFAGTRYGALVLMDGSWNVIATNYLQGTGVGPQVNFLPGAENMVSTSTLYNPSGAAVDGSGNVYIADYGNSRVLKEALSAGIYSESTVPTSSLNGPQGVSVDGSGNLYIADSGNNRVLKETLSAGSYTESTLPTSALNWPSGIAVDGSGNVYIADTGNNRVLIETLSVGSYTESTAPTSALDYPSGVVVDGGGNIYIADSGNNRVLVETLSAGSYTESTVPTSALNYPGAITEDGRGNIYIADSGNSRVLKETLSAGSYTESIVPTSSLNWPSGVALSGSGNVYIADSGNNRMLKEDFADPPSLGFAFSAPGSTSNDSPQTVTLENLGNAVLSFPVPSSGSNPSIVGNFTLNSNGASSCPLVNGGSSAAGTLARGQSCLLPISFTPTTAGIFSGTLALTDNALNATAPGYTSQSILLSGTGTGSTQQTIDFGLISAQSVDSTLALTVTASSGLPVSLTSITPAICTVSGSTASLLAAGTCTIQASQAGNPVYAAAPAVAQSFTVNLLAQTITFSAIPAQIISTLVPVTLSATASSGLPVNYTSTTSGICMVSGSTMTILADGTCTIQASQPGDDVMYAPAPTVTQSFTAAPANPLTGTSFGTVNIGSASTATAVPITFNTAATLDSVSVVTEGATGLDFANASTGTCTAGTSYNAGANCTISVIFTPTLAGTRYGAVVLYDGSGNVIATNYLQGTGVGPQVNFLPGAESMVPTSALAYPSGVAVDGSGNVYIADSGNNRVLKETLSAGIYTESTVSTSSLSGPQGVSVDGSGNLYIADSGNNRVLKETLSAGSYTESKMPASSLSGPEAVAVDGSGNVYIADTGNNRVLIETLSVGSYTESEVPTSSLDGPVGVAVDGNGNVFIADTGNCRVLMETLSAGSYTESTVLTSALWYPWGVAVDGSGNVYIADTGNNRVLKEAISSGSYTESSVASSGQYRPTSVAIDGSGNVYITDFDYGSGNSRVMKEDFADPPSLSFALTAPGSTSSDSPQTVTLENVGNAVLSFPVPSSGSNPSIVGNFTLNSSGASSCPLVNAGSSAAGTLAGGQSCLLPISFAPTKAGIYSGTLALTDNTLNSTAPGHTTQSILLSGTGTGSTQQSIAFWAIPNQSLSPIGWKVSTVQLTATASSGLPVSFTSATPAICSVSASTATPVAAGTCAIQANQAGNSVYSAAPTVIQSFTVNGMAQTITFGAIPAQAVNTSTGITLNAWASSYLPVSLISTTPSTCTVSGSMVTLLAPGTCTIQASQAGNGFYAAASTITQSFTVESANPLTDSNFGTVNIGSAYAAIAVPITFNTAATLDSVSVVTEGATGLDFANAGAGTCTAETSYNIGDSCTVNVTFKPTLTGTRYGAVVLDDGSGNVIATSYLQGTGVGPQVNFLPGAESVVSASALNNPSGVAVDASGNLYIADTYNQRVLKETFSAGSYTESTVPTSTLAYPYGVTVDGSGNIYIADTGNNRVLKETLSAGSYTESMVSTSTLASPFGVAVDGSGNVYIADTYNQRVLIETLSAGSYTESAVPTSALSGPYGVAVDGNGNVFIADFYNRRVLKETLSVGSYTESTMPASSLSGPEAVAVDGSGNLYIADWGYDGLNSQVLKEALSGSSYTESIVPTSSLSDPFGVAVDGSGNVYIADSGNNRVLKEDFADPPSLSFTATAPGATSSDSPQTVTLENVGNAALNFPVPSTGNNPSITANFTLNSSGASSCPLVKVGSSTVRTLAAGQSCLLPVSFTPATEGTLSGTLALTDNALNTIAPGYTEQSILLDGTGTGSTHQSIIFGAIPTQTLYSTLALTATADSGLPVSFISATPAICTISGSTASLLAAGICTIQANQAGSSVYAAAPAVTQSFTVNLIAQTITFSAIPAQIGNTTVEVALTATASSGLSVSLSSITPAICTTDGWTVGWLLTQGTCIIQATQLGDGVVYAAAPIVTQSFLVEPANPVTDTSFGAVNIGNPSTAIPVSMNFNTAATLGNISVVTQGSSGLDFTNAGAESCVVGTSYNAGDSCTVNVTFTPRFAGSRYGAVLLNDGSGNVIASSYLQGTGIGPQVNFLPGAERTMPTSALWPEGVAVDASANIYIADLGNGRVLKETLSAGNYTESTVPTSAYDPTGVAVDGSGNLYIADSGDNRILKETFSAGSYTESSVPTSALSHPTGGAVDGSGNVYVADTYNNRVLMETLSAGSYTESVMPTSSLYWPSGIAVDGSGNVYVADTYHYRVLKETLSAGIYTENTMPTNTRNYPTGVAVDGSGNVYISERANAGLGSHVLKETLSAAGSYTESIVPTSSLSDPFGVAVDGSGNIYIADSSNNRVLKEDFADPPSLSFTATAPGATSSDSPQTVTLENVGNAALNFPVPSTGNNPSITANFTLNSSGASSCPLVSTGFPTAGKLFPGRSCILPISFTPTVTGTFSGTLVLTDNALNATAPGYTEQSILLGGTGTGSTQQSITFGAIPAQTLYSTPALTATADSGLPVSFTSATPAICTTSGTTASLLAAGICTTRANQAGSSVYAAAPAVTQSFTVNGLVQTITFGAIPAHCVNTLVGVTATASSRLPVSFTSTTPTICSVSASMAMLLAPGTCTIQASQAGNAIYAEALTVTESFLVEPANHLPTSSNFGLVNIGDSSSETAVSITFGTAATLGSISVMTQGATGLDFANAGTGSCVVGTSYNSGDSCTVNVTFAPTFAGTRYGAVALDDGSGNVIATSYVQGTGVGPQVNFLPGAESAMPTSTLASPKGIASDASGNIYIADSGNNRVLKETLSAGSYTESTVPTSALSYPSGVAVDGSGNVYVADTYNNRVIKETLSAGSYTESTVPTSSLYNPSGVAVDGSGNVYISDSDNNRVLVETLSAGRYAEGVVTTSALLWPSEIAVDGSGNLYVADTGNSRVLKETLSAGSYTESTVPTSALNYPFGVTVDGLGNVYVADTYNSRVLKETLSAGSYTESTVPINALDYPFGVAVDSIGNVYIADTYNNRVLKEDFADSPSLSFAATATGSASSDSPQTITVENVGNAVLSFPVPGSRSNPSIPANFTLNSLFPFSCPLVSAGSSTAGTLAAGQSCLLPISFTPTAVGAISGALVLTDNALNATAPGYTAQSIPLSGTGRHGTQTSQTIKFATAASQITYGVSTISLSATATSGLTVTFTVTAGPATVNDNQLIITGAGKITVAANQSGNRSYSAAPMVSQTITVNPAVLTVTAASPSISYGQKLPAYTATCSGFQNGDTSATLGGAPSLTTTPAAPSAAGQFTINTAVGSLSAPNYIFNFVNGTLTINKTQLTVTAASPTITYGQMLPAYTATYSGFQNGDTISMLGGSPSLTTNPAVPSAVGQYTITAALGSLSAASYTFSFVNGTLTINAPSGTVTVTPASVNFGSVVVNTTSAVKTVTLKNTGKVSISISSFTVAAGTPFAIAASPSTTCTGTLAAGASCIIGLTLTPATTGAQTGSLTIATNASNSPQTVTLSGTGIVPTTLSATAVAFGNVATNESSAIKNVTLKNNQAVALAISSMAVSGNGFALDPSTTCTGTLAAGASCIIGLTLTPATTGAQTGGLTIATNASNSPQTVTLSGTGVMPKAATPVFNPVAGTYDSSQTVTITDATSGATIYYTTNGTTPSASSTKYTGAFTVSATETIKAIAMEADYTKSAVATVAYTIN